MIYIDTKSADPYYNFGCEYYFATEKDLGDDVFLMWKTTPTLMIGKYQNTLEEIDAAYAREKNINVVRRLSGGGTIYTDDGGWQFSYITRSLGSEIEFERFVRPVTDALISLGVDASLTGRNDITVSGKKFSGNAQFKLGASTVHHGSLLFDTDIEELVRATTPKEYKITSKSIKSVRDRVTNIREHLKNDMTPEEFRKYFVGRITDSSYEITPEDDGKIRFLGDKYFRDPEIIFAKSPKFEIEKTVHLQGGTFTIGLTVRHGIIENAGITGDFFSGSGIDPGDALVGVKYSPDAVREALTQLDGKLFRVTTDELVRAIFE